MISEPKTACAMPIGHLAVNVVSLSLEKGMLFQINDDIEVPGRAAVESGFAFSLDTQSGAVVHARRNSDFEDFFLAHPSAALAGFAGLADDPAGAVALAAGPAYGKETLLVAHLAGTMARRDS